MLLAFGHRIPILESKPTALHFSAPDISFRFSSVKRTSRDFGNCKAFSKAPCGHGIEVEMAGRTRLEGEKL